jgi:uracil-DNA glycosylase
LIEELELLRRAAVVLCLGQIAFEETARTLGARLGKFAHAAVFEHGGRHILCSYHVSRQNTQTRRLTTGMFDEVVNTAKRLAGLDISGQTLDDARCGV